MIYLRKLKLITILSIICSLIFINTVNAQNDTINEELNNEPEHNEVKMLEDESQKNEVVHIEEEENNSKVENTNEQENNSKIENINEQEEDNGSELEEDTKKQSIEDGYYQICSALDENKVLDVNSASKDNKANVHLWSNVKGKQQKFKVTYLENGTYQILNCNSTKSLDVAYGEKRECSNVWQYEYNGSLAQQWILEDAGDGYFYIKSKCNDLYLDVEYGLTKNGTNVQMYSKNQSKAQKFKFVKTNVLMGEQILKDGYYVIRSGINREKVLDISEASKNSEAKVQLWSDVGVKQQIFKLTYDGAGCYTIKNLNSKKNLDVAGAGTKNGTKVWQYDANGSSAQNWILVKNSDGKFNIISECNNLCLDVPFGVANNGTSIQVYEPNGSNAQKFEFEEVDAIEGTKSIQDGTYKISMAKNPNQVLDISEGATYSGANVQIWSYTNVLQQKFKIEYVGDGYYIIKNIKSGKVLDVCGGNGYDGANVWQYDYNGTDAQKWIIKPNNDGTYSIISASNDAFLDVECGLDSNGSNVQVYKKNNTIAQKFKLEKVVAIELTTGSYGSSGLKVKGDSNGRSLQYYKIGNGPNVYFATFAVHGFEDGWNNDGQSLTRIAEDFKNKLIEMQDENLSNKWTIYIFPSVNPDGEYHGWTNNGPGRTSLYSMAPGNKGIDINRCWSAGYSSQTKNSRNYNGTEPFQSYESRALRDFLLNKKSQYGQTVLVDLHGWLNETIGDEQIGGFYRSKYGMSKHIYTYGQGYLVNWARTNLGSNGRTARSALVELPEYDENSWKYIDATIEMLRNIN